MPKYKNSNETFWVIFKQCGCVLDTLEMHRYRFLFLEKWQENQLIFA